MKTTPPLRSPDRPPIGASTHLLPGSLLLASVLLAILLTASPGWGQEGEAHKSDELGALPEGSIFVDVTAEAGLDFVHWNGMIGELYIHEILGGGGALLDYDGDGDLDLFVVQGALADPAADPSRAVVPPPPDLRHRLFRNVTGEGGASGLRFVDATDDAGITLEGQGMGATAGDFDNDGDVDLYVTHFGPNALLRNRGDGTFEEVTGAAGVGDPRWSLPAAFLDVDGDGFLDLYVANYVDFRISNHRPCYARSGALDYCGPQSYEPSPDRLYRNRGDGTFEDVSISSGVAAARGAALGVVGADFDLDHRLDVFVANDGGANLLWQRTERTGDGLRLADAALLAGTAVNAQGMAEGSMGVDVGDVDGDGDEDLFLSHLVRETNTLYLNEGDGFFADATDPSGLGLPSFSFTGFGLKLADVDLDGRLDAVVVNGAIKSREEQVRRGVKLPLAETDLLFLNRTDRTQAGDGRLRFVDATSAAGPAFAEERVSRGLAVGDLDDDGDPDLVIFDNNARLRLLENTTEGAAWIGLEVRNPALRRHALHARVGVFAPGRNPAWRRVRRDGSYNVSSDPRVVVGLGNLPDDDALRVRVEWLDGSVEEWTGLAPGRYHRLEKGGGRRPGTAAR